jgi:signal transduction histidine kinase
MSARAPSIRQLLLAVNAFVLLVPLLAMVALRIYDTHLVQQTEQQLIAQSILIAEAWRDRLLEEEQLPWLAGSTLPPGTTDRYAPIHPRLDLRDGVAPPEPPITRTVPPVGEAFRAGARLKPLLDRAQLVNLSGVRILDAEGCTVAWTGDAALLGACIDGAPEVREALQGRYASVVRHRAPWDEAPLGGAMRRGNLRVYTATPVFADGEVVGVVRMARTSMTPTEALWLHRRKLLLGLGGCVALTALLSLFLSRTISRPMQEITAAAQAAAHGEPPPPVPEGRIVPAEVRTMREALDRMTRQLTDRAHTIAEFAATASHELKTPLTGIRGAAELLREDDAMPPAQRRRFLDNIEADVGRMQRLTDRLLHLARIQSAPETAEAIDVRAFLSRLAQRYDGAVQADLEGAPPSITMNPDHLESAVRNLLDNAVRHGAGKPVALRARAHDGRLRLEIADQGPGISERNRERLFTRFFTTERDRGGTGLGLAIVKAVADTRGGSVDCATGPGGTTFTLVV